jgi:thiol-disulfide isomerase/thioredoxin
MSSVTTAAITAILVVLVIILGYYLITGVWPGAKIIQQRPPGAPPTVQNQDKPTPDVIIDPGQAKFMFFYASWCPHCKDAEPIVQSFKQLVQNSNYTYGGHSITFEDINAYVDKGKSALYKIKAYPTFKVETKDGLYEMTGRPSVANFRAFLVSALGPEKSG